MTGLLARLHRLLGGNHAGERHRERLGLAWEVSGRLRGSTAADRWVREALTATPQSPSARRDPAAKWQAGLIAAAVLLVAGFFAWRSTATEGELLVADAKLPTQVALADGSTVTLDNGARAHVLFDRTGRRIELHQGRAFFAVAKDPLRPFTVRTQALSVVALGTRFDVVRAQDRTEVTLVEGRIRIEPQPGSRFSELVMESGSRLTVDARGWKVEKIDTSQSQAWSLGKQVFEAAPLAQVATELNRYAKMPIEVDPALGDKRLSGVFSLGDTNALADAVPALFPNAGVERTGGKILIERKGPR